MNRQEEDSHRQRQQGRTEKKKEFKKPAGRGEMEQMLSRRLQISKKRKVSRVIPDSAFRLYIQLFFAMRKGSVCYICHIAIYISKEHLI